MQMPYNPLNGANFKLLRFNVGARTANPILQIPNTLVTVTPFTVSQAMESRTLTFSGTSPMQMDGIFFINNKVFDMNRIDYRVPLNNVEIWTLQSTTPMAAHPFHLHGNTFYILDRNGVPPPAHERGRKDVVLVLPQERVRVITKYEDFASATPYMFHCHILMHEDDGMMGQFVVGNLSGIHDHNPALADLVRVYPNPSDGKALTIDMTDKTNPILGVKIFNSIGQLIDNQLIDVPNTFITFQNLALPNGQYLLNIATQNGHLTKKITINH
ncbi:MAG: hypothetical protein RIS64_4244, partial [Bacteroidota bacterium]